MVVMDPALSPNGIKIGDGRLHPFLDLELRFDDYSALATNNTGATKHDPVTGDCAPGETCPFSELLLHVRPGLTFELPYQDFNLSLGGNFDYVVYTGILNPGDTAAFSRPEGAGNLSLAINRTGAVELDLGDQVSDGDSSHDAAIGVGVISLYNIVNVGVPIHPGGHALEITPHGSFTVESFKPLECASLSSSCTAPDIATVSNQNYQNINAGLDARLLFLPKTAFVFNSGVDLRYPSDATVGPGAQLLKATVGLAGLITPHLSGVLKVGWAYDFEQLQTAETRAANSVIGQAEVSWLPTDLTTLRVGFIRSYEAVPVYGTYLDDRPYLDVRTLLAGRLSLHLGASFDWLYFAAHGGAVRTDQVLSIDVGPQYEFTRWLIGSLGYIRNQRFSDQSGPTNNYTRDEAYARVTFTY